MLYRKSKIMAVHEYETRKRELIALITAAFSGVERGNGVTLHEAWVIDVYGSKEERVKARKRDTETRWQDVPHQHISAGGNALYFFDPEGFHYYLPAFLVWYVEHINSGSSNTFFIVDGFLEGRATDTYYQERFATLTGEQSNAVAQYLVFVDSHQKKWVESEAAALEAVQKEMLARGEWTREEVERSRAAHRERRESDTNDETATRALDHYWGQFL